MVLTHPTYPARVAGGLTGTPRKRRLTIYVGRYLSFDLQVGLGRGAIQAVGPKTALTQKSHAELKLRVRLLWAQACDDAFAAPAGDGDHFAGQAQPILRHPGRGRRERVAILFKRHQANR